MTERISRLQLDRPAPRRLVVEGVADCHTAEQLAEALRDLGPAPDVAIDLSGVEFIDSSGLRVLVTAHQELEAREHRLAIVAVSPAVDRLLAVTGLGDVFHVGVEVP